MHYYNTFNNWCLLGNVNWHFPLSFMVKLGATFMVKGVPSNGVEFVSCGVLEYSFNDAWCEGIKMWETTDNISQGTYRAWRPSQ